MAQAPVPDEVLECGLLGLDEADLGRCCPACGRWRRAAEADALWQPLLRRNFAGRPYRTLLTAEGVVAWLARADRERAAEEVLGSRGHLRELQRSPRLKDLLRYLRHRHNGVEVELLSAKPVQPWFNVGLVNARLTLEIVNFWPHCSWVLLRCQVPLEEPDEGAARGGDVVLGGSARVRCWEGAALPRGRLGPGWVFLLDCGAAGELFRVPRLSSLEVGAHRAAGHAEGGVLRLEFAMGRWPQDAGVPLAESCADAFLDSTLGDAAYSIEDGAAPEGLDAEWLEGRPLPGGLCVLGPALYRTVVDLDVGECM